MKSVKLGMNTKSDCINIIIFRSIVLRAICKDYSVKYVHSSIQDLASLMQILTCKTAYKFVFDAKSFLKSLISLNPDLDLSGEKIII